MKNLSILRHAAAACCSLLLVSNSASADELGITITPFGVGDFGAGQLPPPTPVGTIAIATSYYSARVNKNGNGDDAGDNYRNDVKSVALAYIRMTETEFLNANYGFGIVIPFIDIKGSISPVGAGVTLSNGMSGIGDVQFVPIILQWNISEQFQMNASLQVQAPTGEYNTTDAFTVGVNHWAIAPVVAATYITETGLELSTRVELNFNTKNIANDYVSGVGYKQEFAVGQHFGPFTIGIGGYGYANVTDDSGSATSPNKGRVFALGPAITYFQPGMPLIGFHAYKEFGARNRPEGYNVALRVGMTF